MDQKTSIDYITALQIAEAQKALLVLVLLGRKPSTHIDLFKCNEEEPEDLKKAIIAVGLFYAEQKMTPGHPDHTHRFAVAPTQEVANKLKHASEHFDLREAYLLMGFPGSAIDVFVGSHVKGLRQRDYPEDMLQNPLAFKFSVLNKNKEFELVRAWKEALHEAAPELHYKLYEHKLMTVQS